MSYTTQFIVASNIFSQNNRSTAVFSVNTVSQPECYPRAELINTPAPLAIINAAHSSMS